MPKVASCFKLPDWRPGKQLGQVLLWPPLPISRLSDEVNEGENDGGKVLPG